MVCGIRVCINFYPFSNSGTILTIPSASALISVAENLGMVAGFEDVMLRSGEKYCSNPSLRGKPLQGKELN